MNRKLYLIWLGFLSLCLTSTAIAQTPTAELPLAITAVHTEQFPEVQVGFRLNTPVANPLDPATYHLAEVGRPVETFTLAASDVRAPVSLLIVLDQGRYSANRYRENYGEAELKQLLYLLADGYLQANGDTVGLLAGRWDAGTNGRFQSQLILPLTDDLGAYTQTLDALDLDLSGVAHTTIQAVETPDLLSAAFDTIANAPNPVILFLSAVIHAPREPGSHLAQAAAERLAAEAQGAGVRLYVLQAAAHTLTPDTQKPMQTLAGNTGGRYLELRADYHNVDAVKSLYGAIWPTDKIYTLAYHSADNTSGERAINLALAAAPEQADQILYTVELATPELPEPTEMPPLLPAATAVATPRAEVEAIPEAAPGVNLSGLALRLLPWFGLAGAAVYVAIVRRQRLPQVTQGIRRGARRLTTILAGTSRQPVIAYLDVLAARDDLVGETLDLITDITTLGRDPQLSDIQLFDEHERSSISGQHCTIQFDQGSFRITDNGSANGTAVNGNPIAADDPYPLQDGDEIILGDKTRRGAHLRFTVAEVVKRRQRVTVAESEWQSPIRKGNHTVTELDEASASLPADSRLPVLDDDETWWKKLE